MKEIRTSPSSPSLTYFQVQTIPVSYLILPILLNLFFFTHLTFTEDEKSWHLFLQSSFILDTNFNLSKVKSFEGISKAKELQ